MYDHAISGIDFEPENVMNRNDLYKANTNTSLRPRFGGRLIILCKFT